MPHYYEAQAAQFIKILSPRQDQTPEQATRVCGKEYPSLVATAQSDEEGVKLPLGNGANPKVRGACTITPLYKTIFEEHKAQSFGCCY